MQVLMAVAIVPGGLSAQIRAPGLTLGLGLGYSLGDRHTAELGGGVSARIAGRFSGVASVGGTQSWQRYGAGLGVLLSSGAAPVRLTAEWFLWRHRRDGNKGETDGPAVGLGIESRAWRPERRRRDITLYLDGRLLAKGPVRATLFAGVRLRLSS
jgi:hypothetical protein